MFPPTSALNEITLPAGLVRGASGRKVRQLQEWLTLHGAATAIDGGFGEATERAILKFQADNGLATTGRVTQNTWAALVAPMKAALDFQPEGPNLRQAMNEVAAAHLAQNPREVGGDNCGPWVRLYMNGNDGAEWRWCAGFVCFVMAQACEALGRPKPFPTTFSCDTLAANARARNAFCRGEDIAEGNVRWSDFGELAVFLVRRSPGDWSHTGFAFDGQGTTFSTYEGNTNDEGSSNGYEVCCRFRSTRDKDFIFLPS